MMKNKQSQQWQSVPNLLQPTYVGKCSMIPGEALQNPVTGLRVWESFDTLDNGLTYQHISVAHADRYPTWEELLEVKGMLMDDEDEAVQVLPRKSEYVNLHPNCFHLWHCLDGDMIGR